MVIPTTSTIRHATHETDDVKYTHSSDVAKDVLDMLTPILHDAVDSGKPTYVKPSRYWIRIDGTAGRLLAHIGHKDFGDREIAKMTVTPPEYENGPAGVDVEINGMFVAIKVGDIVDRVKIVRVALGLSDLERCIAWTWLFMTGHAR